MRRIAATIAPVAFIAALVVAWFSVRPSADREWAADQARMPRSTFEGDTVRIENVRNFDHCPPSGEVVTRWEDRTCDLSGLESVWMILSVFKQDWRGPAHPIVSFGFADSTFLAVSVEARREVGESYATWKGMLRKFELTYVVASEEEIVKLRAVCRTDRVYLYPIDTSPERGRALLTELLESANALAERPEFYNTLWKNCTTELIERVNAIATEPIPGGIHSFLPGYSDRVVHSLGLIDSEGTIEEVRSRYRIDPIASEYSADPRFSLMIRRGSDPRPQGDRPLED